MGSQYGILLDNLSMNFLHLFIIMVGGQYSSFGYCRDTVHDDLSTAGGYTGFLQSGSLDFTGDSDVTPADLPAAVASLKWKSFGTAGFTWSTPVVLDDKVFLQDQDGGFDAFNINALGFRIINEAVYRAITNR